MLVAPLDWGLGHATRMIPVIKFLHEKGCRVIIAADGLSGRLLKDTFPHTEFISAPGFPIRYSKQKKWMPWVILLQLPRLAYSLFKEHRWLKKVCRSISVDLIISDNRPGLFHPRVKSVYITHQLAIQTGNRLTDNWVRTIHYWFINRFSHCWVPDLQEPDALAGQLSNPPQPPEIQTSYLGPLSRFEMVSRTDAPTIDILLLLSGPEPQRSLFEKRLCEQIGNMRLNVCLVRGVAPETTIPAYIPEKVEVHNFVPAEKLNHMILSADWVVCRSGYSSVMDLVKLGQKAVLVPTPGQTEQEYLAHYLLEKGYFYSEQQDIFNLTQALEKAARFNGRIQQLDMDGYKRILGSLISSCAN